MRQCSLAIAIALVLLTVAGCATMHPDYETPAVNVSTIRPLPAEGLAPRFEIGLHIVNPNRSPLALHGIAYSLKLEGYKILTGVANDLPIIEGYGEGDVSLIASVSLFSGIRLLSDLMNARRETISFDLEAKLDLGGFRPAVYVVESGEIDLSGNNPIK